MLLYMIVLLVFFCAAFLILSLGRKNKHAKINVLQRLGRSVPGEEALEEEITELKGSFAVRIIAPLFYGFFEFLAGLGGMSTVRQIKMLQAGINTPVAVGAFLAAKLFGGVFLTVMANTLMSVPAVGYVLVFLLGWSLPELYVNSRRRKKEEEIEKTLPDTLDLLMVSVEAGLGFDGAMIKVSEKSGGILAGEFRRLIKENKMGKNRRDSLRDMATRLGNENVTAFTGSIIQAEQLGISFSNVLRLQAEQVRRKRKQRIEEMAMKAPVKMLIPLVLFIFPTIFIVLLGPAALMIITLFQ